VNTSSWLYGHFFSFKVLLDSIFLANHLSSLIFRGEMDLGHLRSGWKESSEILFSRRMIDKEYIIQKNLEEEVAI
jgi:hypothetical protein